MNEPRFKIADADPKNAERRRWYGIRVGDTVDFSAFGIKRTGGLVVAYTMDNNGVMVQWPDLEEPVKEVAEWLTVTEKIEDKQITEQ